jgi:integrase
MARPRKNNLNLPPNVHLKHGAYYFVQAGKWERLANTLPAALAAYGRRIEKQGVAGIPNTLPRLIDKFVAERAAKLKPKSQEMYRRCANLLKPVVADFLVHQLNAADVTQLVHGLAVRRGATTANQCRATLSSVYSFAIELGAATSNPVRDTHKIPIPKRTRYLENDELEKIAAKGPPMLRAVINLAYVTGQRISDVLDLAVEQQTDGFICFVQRKTGHRMKLRRTRNLASVIAKAQAVCRAALLEAHRDSTPTTIVFNRKGEPYTYFGFSTIWQRARAASGVIDARIHDVRAKALTDAEEQGLDAQRLAGHASRATTEIYLRGRRAFIADPLPSLPKPNPRPRPREGDKATAQDGHAGTEEAQGKKHRVRTARQRPTG